MAAQKYVDETLFFWYKETFFFWYKETLLFKGNIIDVKCKLVEILHWVKI
jgi:hypothetical protein